MRARDSERGDAPGIIIGFILLIAFCYFVIPWANRTGERSNSSQCLKAHFGLEHSTNFSFSPDEAAALRGQVTSTLDELFNRQVAAQAALTANTSREQATPLLTEYQTSRDAYQCAFRAATVYGLWEERASKPPAEAPPSAK